MNMCLLQVFDIFLSSQQQKMYIVFEILKYGEKLCA